MRLQGYQDALAEAGLRADPELVESGMPNEEGGERAMLNLLAKGLPITAVVAYNDAMAAGAISVLADNGLKVPEEVSVVGFDDIIYARYLRPKLSTMRYPVELMAAQAAKLALQLAAGESEAVQSRIYPDPDQPSLGGARSKLIPFIYFRLSPDRRFCGA